MPTKTKHTKKPKLRFHGFSGEWEEKKLGEVATFLDNKRIPLEKTDRMKRQGQYPYYGASGIIDYVDEYLFDGEFILLGEDGANIILRSSPLAFLAKGRFWVNNHAHVLQSNGASNAFLATYLETLRYDKYNTGTAQPKLNVDACKKIKINVPTPVEQQKIADFLGSVDSLIESLNAQKTALETYKRGMMQKVFSQQIRFKDENGKNFSGWKKVELGNVVTFLKGKGISKDEVIENGKNECIRYGELYTDYGEVITEIKSKTDIPANESVLSVKGDILIPSSGETVIDIATVSCVNVDGVLLGGDLNILRPKQEQNGAFFAYYLSNFQNINIARLAQGNSVVHLYASHLKTLKIELPSFPEQEKIADFLISLDNLIESKQEQVTKAEQWKKGLMQKMFV